MCRDAVISMRGNDCLSSVEISRVLDTEDFYASRSLNSCHFSSFDSFSFIFVVWLFLLLRYRCCAHFQYHCHDFCSSHWNHFLLITFSNYDYNSWDSDYNHFYHSDIVTELLAVTRLLFCGLMTVRLQYSWKMLASALSNQTIVFFVLYFEWTTSILLITSRFNVAQSTYV